MNALCLAALLAVSASAVVAQAPAPAEAPARLTVRRGGLPNVLAKLNAGKPVRIAYFGGSITAAAGWRVKTLEWFRKRWPAAKVEEVNATIGGTGSDLAAYRCGQDVLSHKPDLVFVEFAVNDGGAPPEQIVRTMEGIVRQTWRAGPTTDICFVYTFVGGFEAPLQRGVCPPSASADERVAERYGIPAINVALRIAEMQRDDKLVVAPEFDAAGAPQPDPKGRVVFSHDRVHPLDAGHAIYAEIVQGALEEWSAGAKPKPHALGKPMNADNWEDATLAPVQASMVSPGWKHLGAEDGLVRAFGGNMPGIWEARAPGETLIFRFMGTGAGVYDLMGPDAGRVVVTVDGKESGPISRFDVFCTYHRLANFPAAGGLAPGEHTVTVRIDAVEPDRSAVVNAERAKPGFDANRYKGTVIRAGGLLLRGRLLP